jgi:endoglucanase
VDGEPALAIGEFGAPHEGDNALWQMTFVNYLLDRDIQHFFYWGLNPNSEDTGGLLLDDWWTLDEEKYNAILPLLERS